MARPTTTVDGPLAQSLLMEHLFLCPEDNNFYWLADRGAGKAGMMAGTRKESGKKRIGISGKQYPVENLRELYLHGKFLAKEKSLPRGVTYIPRLRKFKAVFYVKGGKSKYLGLHANNELAHRALKDFEKGLKNHG